MSRGEYLQHDTSLQKQLVPTAYIVILKRVSLSEKQRTVCSSKTAPPLGK